MSGNYGWGGRDRADDFQTRTSYDSGFSRARSSYDTVIDNFAPSACRKHSDVRMTQTGSQIARNRIDLSTNKKQACSKENLIVIGMDTTGSMGIWREEILQRLALLYKEAQGFLGESLEILFLGFGDLVYSDPIEVCPIGDGPILDEYIDALTKHTTGGGNAVESSEMVALYVANMLNTDDAKSVHFFTITDEGFYPEIDPAYANSLFELNIEARYSHTVYKSLKTRMNVYTILPQTDSYNGQTRKQIQDQWEEAVGSEFTITLDDSRRVVDVIIGAIAKMCGQYSRFTTSLVARQGNTRYGSENIQTVHESLAHLPGAPETPTVKDKTKSLLDL